VAHTGTVSKKHKCCHEDDDIDEPVSSKPITVN